MDSTTEQRRLHHFTCDVLEAITLEELRSTLSSALGRLLPAHVRCDVAWGTDRSNACEGERYKACLAIGGWGRLHGVALLYWNGDEPLDPRNERVLAYASEIAAAALSNRKRSDAMLEQARAEAAEVKFDLIGMLAHEMRTPLASIKGYSSAMLLEDVDWDRETTVEFLQAIDEESDRLTEMVNHLLDSTVIEAGVLELRREPVLLTSVIRRTVEKMAHRTDRHRLLTSFGEGFPVVFADEERIQQVMTNLLDNAIKYSPDGGLIVVSGEARHDEVLIRVSDQGVGIAPEHLNKLFERFFRTEQRRNHGVSGTGLGLPIADAIVRAHGGRIWAESVVDEGTTFSFTLPIDGARIETGDDAEGTD